MRKTSTLLAALACLGLVAPLAATPASAYVVKKVVRHHAGPFGGCRTVRKVMNGPGGRRVVVHKSCG